MIISLRDFAKNNNRDDAYLRRLARNGKIPAYKIGKMWVIDENTVLKDRRFKETALIFCTFRV